MTKQIATVDRTRELLELLQVRPLKRLGQNFLVQPDVATAIVNLYPLQADDTVIEIGPGLGALTELLCAKVKRVYAIEYDHGLAAALNQTIKSDNLTVIDNDVLKQHSLPHEVVGQPVIVYSNVPYYITTDVALHVLTQWNIQVRAMVLLVQKEVALKWTKNKLIDESTASECILRGLCDIKLGLHVSHHAFYPKPDVHSAVVIFMPRVDVNEYRKTIRLIQDAYATKRKTVVSTLVNSGYPKEHVINALVSVQHDEKVRPTDISFEQWHVIAQSLGERYEKK